MHRPMLIILGIGILAGVAIGFLANSTSPFGATLGIKFLFLVSVGLVLVCVSALMFYAIAVAWHEGGQYFLAKYFGHEAEYFKTSFRRAVWIGVLGAILFSLRRYGFFTKYFAGGATAIILFLELYYSLHDKQSKHSV